MAFCELVGNQPFLRKWVRRNTLRKSMGCKSTLSGACGSDASQASACAASFTHAFAMPRSACFTSPDPTACAMRLHWRARLLQATGFGHCDPPSVRSPTIRLDAVPESRRQLCTATCLPCIAIPGSGAPGKASARARPKGYLPPLRDCNMEPERTYPQRTEPRARCRAAGSVARLRQPETNSEFPSKVGARREQ
jgi:hypothetical protein